MELNGVDDGGVHELRLQNECLYKRSRGAFPYEVNLAWRHLVWERARPCSECSFTHLHIIVLSERIT